MKIKRSWIDAYKTGVNSKRQNVYYLLIFAVFFLLALPVVLLILALQLVAALILMVTGKRKHGLYYRQQKIEKVVNPH